jgi:hypothetical protein
MRDNEIRTGQLETYPDRSNEYGRQHVQPDYSASFPSPIHPSRGKSMFETLTLLSEASSNFLNGKKSTGEKWVY